MGKLPTLLPAIRQMKSAAHSAASFARENVGTDEVRGELAGLPDLKTEDPAVRQTIIDWQTDWIDKATTSKGNTIDYFRVDTVKHVEDATWMAFKNAITEKMPEHKMIGETWGASAKRLWIP